MQVPIIVWISFNCVPGRNIIDILDVRVIIFVRINCSLPDVQGEFVYLEAKFLGNLSSQVSKSLENADLHAV